MKVLTREEFEVGVGVNFNGTNKDFLIFTFQKIDKVTLKTFNEKTMCKYLAISGNFSNEEEARSLIDLINIILNLKFLSKELKKSDIKNDYGIFVQVEIEIDHVNKSLSTAFQADIVHCGVIKHLEKIINHKIYNIK